MVMVEREIIKQDTGESFVSFIDWLAWFS